MIASSPSPTILSQTHASSSGNKPSPRNVWSRPSSHISSSLFTTTTAASATLTAVPIPAARSSRSRPRRQSSASSTGISTSPLGMRKSFLRSPRPARPMRDSSTQWSSPEDLGSHERPAATSGKRKARSKEEDEQAQSESGDSPPRPRLTPQTHAATPGQQKSGGPPSQEAGSSTSATTSATPAESKIVSQTQAQNIIPDSTLDSTPSKRPRPLDPATKLVPIDYEDCPTSDLVPIIASMLMELIRHNDDMPVTNTGLTRFHSRAPPGISVQDYLQRLAHHATLSPPILLCMVYYIDRLCAIWPKFTINSLTVHRYLITSATVASKGLSDSFWTNATYARVGGVSLKELALLELEFLWRIEWRIVPKPEVLVDYYKSLVQRCDGYEITGLPPAGSEGGIGENGDAASSGEMIVDAEMEAS